MDSTQASSPSESDSLSAMTDTTTSSFADVSNTTSTDLEQPTIQLPGTPSTPDELISSSASSSASTSISALASSDTPQASTTNPPPTSTSTHGNNGCQHHEPSTTSNGVKTLRIVGFVLLAFIVTAFAIIVAFFRLRHYVRRRNRSIDALGFNREKMVKHGSKVSSDSWVSDTDLKPWSGGPGSLPPPSRTYILEDHAYTNCPPYSRPPTYEEGNRWNEGFTFPR